MRARLALCAVVVAGTSFPVGFAGPACAGEGGSAALVVDTGQTEYRYCVALPDGDVSGIDVIELAGRQHGLSYRLGFGGKAVCMLAGVGTDSDDCFEKYPEFWGYWRGDGSGGWSWSSSGADSTTVEDGDVEGWSWGSGSDGSSHQQPPTTRFSDVCAASASSADRDRRDRGSQRSGGDEDVAGSDSPRGANKDSAPLRNSPYDASSPPAGDNQPDVKARVSGKRDRRARSAQSAGGDAVAEEASAASQTDSTRGEGRDEAAASTSSGRSPVVPALALGATALLVGAGLVIGRRRRAG